MIEWRNGRTVEWRIGGMADRWNGGSVEWRKVLKHGMTEYPKTWNALVTLKSAKIGIAISFS